MKLTLRKLLVAVAAAAALPAAAWAQTTPPDSVVAVTRSGQTFLRVNVDGKVGIGTSTPDRRLTVNGTIGATDTIATGVGIRFPDGTLQTSAAANVNGIGTSSNTPNTLVKRDSLGGFAAGRVTLDSLLVLGVSRLGTTRVTGVVSATDTVASGVGFKFPDGTVQTTAATSASAASGTSASTPNTLVSRDANASFAAGKITLDSLAVGGRSALGATSVTGQLSVTDTVTTGAGFRFPDGSVQTTAAVSASGTSANTPNTLVQRDANGSFAAGKITLDSLAVGGRSALSATSVTGKLSVTDTVTVGVGVRYPDGSVQTTAATTASGTSANTPNTLVQRDASGSFAAGQATLDSLVVARRATLGAGTVVTGASGSLASEADSMLAVRYDNQRLFRVNRNGSALFAGEYNSGATNGAPADGAGTRMFWYPGKAAFRAGAVSGTQWDDANIGLYSTALGEDVRALGDNAIAVGKRAVAANTGTVAMGEDVTATGANSVVLGYRASSSTGAGAPRLGTFVFGDRSSSTTGDTIHAEVTNSATWRVVNGFRIYTSTNLSTGVIVLPGMNGSFNWSGCSHTSAAISTSSCGWLSSGGVWTNSSDVNRKHLFEDVAGEDVLARLRTIPIRSWSYRTEPDAVRHLGPTAQDFRAAFGLGTDERSIATVDADGVALAAAQALEKRTAAQQARIETLERENAELRARLARIEALLTGAAPRN